MDLSSYFVKLSSPVPGVRVETVLALIALGEEGIQAVKNAIESPVPEIRMAVLEACGSGLGVAALTIDVLALTFPLLDETDTRVFWRAIDVIRKYISPEHSLYTQLLDKMIALTTHPNTFKRSYVMGSIYVFQEPQVVERLIWGLADWHYKVVESAIYSLKMGKYLNNYAFEDIFNRFAASDKKIIPEILKRVSFEQCYEPLIQLFKLPDSLATTIASRLIQRLPKDQLIPKLELLATEGDGSGDNLTDTL